MFGGVTKMKALGFLRKRWKYVLTALIALIIGASGGPSEEQLDSANAKIDELKKELSTKTETVASLETKNKDLQAKVDEAAPFFKLKDEELKQKEAEAKAAEEKRLAEEKAKQEAEAKAKAKAEAETSQQLTEEKVTEIIEYYSLGEDDKLTNVSVEDGEIKATIELAPNELIPSPVDMAVSGYSGLSDELLNHDGWEILNITYANIGTVSMNRNEKETNDFGNYYFPILEIEERLK
jgi:hypothetical protein